jgi:UPF0755 protein
LNASSHRGARGRVLGGFLAFVLLLAVIGGALAFWHYRMFATTPLQPVRAQVEIHRGDSFRTVLATLRDAGIRQGKDLEWQALAWQLGVRSRLQVGEYAIAAGTTPEQLLWQFNKGRVVQYRFTIVEGWNIRELRAALAQAPRMKHELADLDDAALMVKLGRIGVHPEGRFLPETYQYTRGTSDVAVLKRAAKDMDTALANAWRTRDRAIPLRDPEQALILASIVEKETARADERPRIAGVFTRRLKLGMLLETDPTVIYGLGSSYDGKIHKRDLLNDTPYNTYTRAGLPPTPIAMPGRAALQAATHPAPGDALYFVARGDGSHEFTSNYADHLRAVAKYQLGHAQPDQGQPDQGQPNQGQPDRGGTRQ